MKTTKPQTKLQFKLPTEPKEIRHKEFLKKIKDNIREVKIYSDFLFSQISYED